jgi:hypothetical protein
MGADIERMTVSLEDLKEKFYTRAQRVVKIIADNIIGSSSYYRPHSFTTKNGVIVYDIVSFYASARIAVLDGFDYRKGFPEKFLDMTDRDITSFMKQKILEKKSIKKLTKEERASLALKKESMKKQALAKLTPEEKKLLKLSGY